MRHRDPGWVRGTCCERPDTDLRVRIGIAAGEPVDHNDDLFGSTVTLAQPDLRCRRCRADPDVRPCSRLGQPARVCVRWRSRRDPQGILRSHPCIRTGVEGALRRPCCRRAERAIRTGASSGRHPGRRDARRSKGRQMLSVAADLHPRFAGHAGAGEVLVVGAVTERLDSAGSAAPDAATSPHALAHRTPQAKRKRRRFKARGGLSPLAPTKTSVLTVRAHDGLRSALRCRTKSHRRTSMSRFPVAPSGPATAGLGQFAPRTERCAAPRRGHQVPPGSLPRNARRDLEAGTPRPPWPPERGMASRGSGPRQGRPPG